jgi:hypothetical protein
MQQPAEETMPKAAKQKPHDRDLKDDVQQPDVASPPRSDARHDEGSGANETVDGLDEYQEAARHGAEDIPASEQGDDFKRLPVFDRGESEPKV